MSSPSAETEIRLERARAARALMESGATRDEALAAVDEQLRHSLAEMHQQTEAALAIWADVLEQVGRDMLAMIEPAAAQLGAALDAAWSSLCAGFGAEQPTKRIPDDARWAAVIVRKRRGMNAGPARPRLDGIRRRRDVGLGA